MPETYLDSSIVGFNHQDALDLKVDTYSRLAPILNMKDAPAIGPDFAYNLQSSQSGTENEKLPVQSIDMASALRSRDSNIKTFAQQMLDSQADKTPEFKYNLGNTVESPYSAYAKKFMSKDFGYSALRDNEDFYYRNDYMKDGWFMRNIIKNPVKFIARVIPQAVLKLGEGLGYIGSMVTSIGSDNYWANVADNSFSHWLEGLEQEYKDQVIPVYKQAGFNEKGFFSKLLDWSFWNDEVADGVAFFGSALVPGLGFSKLGTLGKFGRAFSATTKLGRGLSKIGMGSWAELSSWTFNTAMEASQEGAGVFKEVKRRLEEGRAQGLPEYADLTDDQIKERAGNMAANTIAGNFAVLALSNAWENTLFFKPLKNVEGRANLKLNSNFTVSSPTLEAIEKGGIRGSVSSLGRASFYGKQALKGFLAEGLWEENAQLAIQRMNQGDTEGRGFFSQLGKQTIDAFTGRDREASESIGLGAVIGIGAPVIMSKIANERRNILANTRDAIEYTNTARQNLFDINDIYERGDDNSIVYENDKPKIDKAKFAAKQKVYEEEYGKLTLSNEDDYFQSEPVKFSTRRALANYVRSLYSVGVKDVSSRLSSVDPENATLFGMNPTTIKQQSGEFSTLSQKFEDIAKDVTEVRIPIRPKDMTEKEFSAATESRRAEIFKRRSDNTILTGFVTDNQSKLLQSLNNTRTLQNASLAQFPVDQLNTLIQQQKGNEQFMKSPQFKELSAMEQEYHTQRASELDEQINTYKATNELMLKDSERTPSGFYIPTYTDYQGNKKIAQLSGETGLVSKNVAHLLNEIDKNNYIDSLLSDDKKGHENFLEFRKDSLNKAIESAIAAMNTTATSKKYTEQKQGDFQKVTELVTKMIFGENQEYSPEELQLQSNYTALIEEILPRYENAVEEQRIKNLSSRLATMKNTQQALAVFITEKSAKVEDEKINLEYLRLTLEDKQNQKKKTQRSIYKAINGLEANIEFAERRIAEEQEKLGIITDQINLLEQEISGGSFKGLYGALEELKQERDWVATKLTETRDLLGKVKGLLKALLSVARQLFPGFDFKYLDRVFTDEYYGPQNRKNWVDETVHTYDEIKTQADERTNLTNLINELTKVEGEIKNRYAINKAEIDAILKATNDRFKDQYLDLTKKATNKPSPEKAAIAAGLTADKGLFPAGNNSGGLNYPPDDGFDGDTYQRPLSTKFFTSTFPDYRGKKIKDLPKDVQDYFDFTEFLTNTDNTEAIKKKLGKADLKVLIVTKNNVGTLGLEKALSDRSKYWENSTPETAHIEIIPVMEEGGYFYFVDKDLNKLGRVDEKKTSDEMVRTVLRLPRFTEEEQRQYSEKYTQEDMDLAVKVGTDWRADLLKQTTEEPMVTYDFSITRGIPNKQDIEGGGLAQNPISVLLPESKINGQSVRVYSSPDVQINSSNITVPVGRPFIYTNNGVHEQLHAADNKILTTTQVDTVSKVLENMLIDHIQRVIRIVENNPSLSKIKSRVDEVGVANLTDTEKTAMYLAVTKGNPSLYNGNYTNWLSSIVYFNKLEKDEKGKYKVPGKNQIYMDGYILVLGTSGFGIDMTNPSDIYSPEVQDFFSSQYHNIKYFPDEAKANREYIEYYLDNEEVKPRSWKTYSHYLISTKTPDGQIRKEIPITTGIKTKEQHDLEKGQDPYYTYLSRGIVVQSDAIPVIAKTIKNTGNAAKDLLAKKKAGKGEIIESSETKPLSAADILRKKQGKVESMTIESSEAFSALKESRKALTGSQILKNKREGKAPDQDIPDYNKDKEADSLPSEGIFRIAKGGAFRIEEDLDAVVADIARMIPQFPVNRLKNAIKVTDGIEAWGEFTNDMINLYEKAEKGTGYHEVFEAVVNKLLSDKEWNAIYKEFKSRKGTFVDRETGTTVNHSLATPHQAKEQMAEEFMNFKLNGTLPSQNQTRSFFQIILDFIKKYILGKATIDNIFTKIDEGRFANSSVREGYRFSSNYRKFLPDLKAQVKRDLMEGATAFMFQQVFFSQESLTQLDEIDLTDADIYEPIKLQFAKTIDVLDSYIKAERNERNPNEKDIQDYTNSIAYIKYALENWGDFVAAHKEFLKPFRIRFEQESLSQTEESLNKQNRNDYLNDEFKTSGKKSASKSVRFLFGTLLQKRFDEKGKVISINNRVVGNTKNYTNSVFMAPLADYDKYMLEALEQFKGMSDFTAIEKKLADMAGITEIEDMKNPKAQAELVSGLSNEKAVWTSLYMKLFGFSQKISPEAIWNLKVKFQNYVSKHSPEPYVFIYGAGNSSIISSTKRTFFEGIIRRVESSIIAQSNLLFSRVKKAGIYTYVPVKEFQKEISFDAFNDVKLTKFINYLGLSDIISSDFIKSLPKTERTELKSKLLKIRNTLTTVETTSLNLRGLNVFGYTSKLIEFLDEKKNLASKETQFFNIENEPQQRHIVPSYISRIIGDVNNLSRDELFIKYPQLDSYFAEDSILMSKLFNEDGTRTSFNLTLGYMEGIKDIDENEGTKASRLEFWDKYWLQFNASLRGLHYSLPADSETEWIFDMGEFVSYSENMLAERSTDIINTIFIPKLASEINTAIASPTNLQQLNVTHKSTGRTIGKSLRFFKDILKSDAKLLIEIHQEIDKAVPADRIVTDKRFKSRIQKAILTYLNTEVAQTINALVDNRLVTLDGDRFILNSVDNSFIEKYRIPSNAGLTIMNVGQFQGLVEYQKINSIVGLMEQFKVFYGDPAQYKDWEKRAKSLFGPIEQTFYDESGEFNNWLTENKNSAVLGEESVKLNPDDWFSKSFTNKIKARTVNDIEVVNVETSNSLRSLQSTFADKFVDAYEKTNEADGQSIGSLLFARELMIKSGWRWTKEHENYFQYDTALMRLELSKIAKSSNEETYLKTLDGEVRKINPQETSANIIRISEGNEILADLGLETSNPTLKILAEKKRKYIQSNAIYQYKSEELRKLDEKIVVYYKGNPPTYPLSPVKTLMPSVDENGNQILLKHSVYFQSYQLAKEFELLDTYIDMLKRGDDLLNFKSAQKVGVMVDNEGKVTDYYQDPFTKNDLLAKGNPQFEIDYRTIGIQVETQTSGKSQRLGSQLSKDINLNLFEDGIPVDFEGTRSEWDALDESEKLAESEFYNLVYGSNGTVRSLEALKIKNTMDTFAKLGVKWSFIGGNLAYNIDDLTKVKEFIHNELQRLQIDENSLENVELTQDLKTFLNPAETLPSYTTISNLLWSMADKATTSMSVNGKPYIQVASTFFNKSSRNAAYFDNNLNKWILVDNATDYTRLAAEGVKLVMTSSELQFYRKGEDGKTLAMEIYLPHIYKEKINEKRAKRGLSRLTDNELMNHLNSNPELLEGIGFRIPTQATSSLEFFKIKGFLPEAFGASVVVPSGITTKAGSDFDVDKLNTYLNNWKLDGKGLPYYEKFLDDTNSTPEDRYVSYVKAQYKDFAVVREEMKSSAEYLDVVEKIEQNSKILQGTRETIDDLKGEQELVYQVGYEIFKTLPVSVKQQYYEAEESLNLQEVEGAEKIMEYIGFTKLMIRSFTGVQAIRLPLKQKVNGKIELVEDIVYPEEALSTLNSLLTSYSEVLTSMGITQKMVDKYLELKEKKSNENSNAVKSFNFELSSVIAEFNKLQSFNEFTTLPLALQNTKGSLENRYFKSIRSVLELPSMFEYLLSPNSIDHIRENRDTVQKAINPDWIPEEKRELDYTRFLSTEYIAEKRSQFTKGKYDIGIFAVAMTNFANTQISGIGVSELGTIKEQDSYVFDTLNEGDIRLPFKDIPLRIKNDRLFIPISVLKDKEGKLTMDKLSSYINGAVDVAKEPYIIEMGMHTELAGVYTLMERMGLSGKTTALFLYQPVIREYLKEILFLDRKTYFGTPQFDKIKDVILSLVTEYGGEEPVYNPEYKFTDEELTNMIRKGELVKKGKAKWDGTEKQAQYLALVNFLKMKMYSNHLVENIQASNHDTSSIRNPYVLTKKDLQLDRSKKGNMIIKVDGEDITNGAEALRDDTFVRTDISLLKNFNDLFSKMELFALQKDNPQSTLLKVASRIYNSNPFIGNDDFISAMREYESAMIDSLTNRVLIQGIDKNGELAYNALHKFASQYFTTDSQRSLKNMYNNLFNLMESGRYVYRDFIEKNYFLSNLQFFTDKNMGVDLMELKKKPSNDDILTKERITESIRAMSEMDAELYPEMIQFSKAVVYGAYIQFGIKYGRTSFVDLIPAEALTELTKAGLENIDGKDFKTLDEQVQRSRWHRRNVVPQKTQRTMHFISPNPNNLNELVLENNETWHVTRGKKQKPSVNTQMFFARMGVNGEVSSFIQPAFIWGGYEESATPWNQMEDIIIIPAIHPDYIIGVTIEAEGKLYTSYGPSPEVDKMKKRGDYSYIYYQEYKKVGIENPALARYIKSAKGKKSISYLYKPIYKYGSRLFNEIPPLLTTPENTVIGEKGILNQPNFKEWEDNELLSLVNNQFGRMLPVFRPSVGVVTKTLKPVSEEKVEVKKRIQMTPDNIEKIEKGTKTTTVRSVTESARIGIKTGQTDKRWIGDKEYLITNRGFLTIEQAGGKEAILKSEGLTDSSEFKFKQSLEWYNGKGKLFVYDIRPITSGGGGTVGDNINRLPCA